MKLHKMLGRSNLNYTAIYTKTFANNITALIRLVLDLVIKSEKIRDKNEKCETFSFICYQDV
jgi:hypothetical protein